MMLYLGVDIGGTFTDVVLHDRAAGRLVSAKVPTDYRDPIRGILAGKALLVDAGTAVAALSHATTLATNALLEGKLPRGALLTTRGFRDVLDIGRIQRPAEGIYDFTIDTPQPLIHRALRLEVAERVDAHGEVVTPLDEAALRAALAALKDADVAAVAIAFLFAFLNPVHETRAAEIVAEVLPGAFVSVSSTVSPEIREFERTSTTVIDALLKPIMTPYLSRLDGEVRRHGVAQVRIMMASGGLTAAALAARQPVTLVNSGPSAGVLAAANLGRAIGAPDLVTIDMGGTSLDIGVVANGRSVQKYESKVAGFPIRTPMIDVAAVAAGGGSIALVDALGYIQVDRESAGSEPGPACYGRGGARPTITDADLLLGRLSGQFGGRGGLALDLTAATRALERFIAVPLGLSPADAAAGVLRVIQARMVKMISANTLEKGLDIRALPLFVYGGAGPTHGVELAEAMGMRRAIVPYLAGNFSAVGLILSPLRWEVSRMVQAVASELPAARLTAVLAELDREARAKLAEAGADLGTVVTRWQAHMRYAGQSYDLAVDLGRPFAGALPDSTPAALVAAFHALHERRYAYRSDAEAIELVLVRVAAEGPETDYPAPQPPAIAPGAPATRPVFFTGVAGWRDAAVHDRRLLAPGAAILGPAVIEGEGSSALVPPGWSAAVDAYLNLDIRR
ncbi:MAG: hydantoinase/oxoprolinase family protein [Proteobacteria bacterium]|nr:hydantoinase/oxoprolinase family protein [Pseudomonadota bacterium]